MLLARGIPSCLELCCNMKGEQTPLRCAGLTPPTTNTPAESQTPWVLSFPWVEERMIFLFLQKEAGDLFWEFLGSIHSGNAAAHCTESCAFRPLSTALCSALPACSR